METKTKTNEEISHTEFKSYYVVWKHDILIIQQQNHNKFKSYYVVWKLQTNPQNNPSHPCLNRTMQYGNLYKASDVVGANASLNRTMQYGNLGSNTYLEAEGDV